MHFMGSWPSWPISLIIISQMVRKLRESNCALCLTKPVITLQAENTGLFPCRFYRVLPRLEFQVLRNLPLSFTIWVTSKSQRERERERASRRFSKAILSLKNKVGISRITLTVSRNDVYRRVEIEETMKNSYFFFNSASCLFAVFSRSATRKIRWTYRASIIFAHEPKGWLTTNSMYRPL